MGVELETIRRQYASVAFTLAVTVSLLFVGGYWPWRSAEANSSPGISEALPYDQERAMERAPVELSLPPSFIRGGSFFSASERNQVWASLWILQAGEFSRESDAGAGVAPLLANPIVDIRTSRDAYLNYVLRLAEQAVRDRELAAETSQSLAAWVDGQYQLYSAFFKAPLVMQAATWVHEARHGEGVRLNLRPNSLDHVICDRGAARGKVRCDRRLSDRGAQAAEFEYLARVAVRGENFHPVYESLGRLLAIVNARNFFNEAPIAPKTTLAALTEDDRLLVLDKGEWFERASLSVPGRLIRFRSAGAQLPVLPRDRLQDPWWVDIYADHPVAGLENFAELMGHGLVEELRATGIDRNKVLDMGALVIAGTQMEYLLTSDSLRFRRSGSEPWCVVLNSKPSDPWLLLSPSSLQGEAGPILVSEEGRVNPLHDLWAWFTAQDCRSDLATAVQASFSNSWIEGDVVGNGIENLVADTNAGKQWSRSLRGLEQINGMRVALDRNGGLQMLGNQELFDANQPLPRIRQIMPIFLFDEFWFRN